MKRKGDSKKSLGVSLIAIGTIFFFASLFIKSWQAGILSFSGEVSGSPQHLPRPQRLMIDSVGIDLGVSEGSIRDGVWEISPNSAVHLDISSSPGGGENIVIYAHNKKNLFGELKRVKVGDIVRVISGSGRVYSYVVYETNVISPKRVEYVSPTGFEVLTLYTCVGIADSKRFVVRARPLFNMM
jgi:LPXTG-site transpeptidase (sortase) family protein